jgi:hypothetical protein
MANWAVDTDIPNFYQTFEGWLRNQHTDGISVLQPWYNYSQRNSLVIHRGVDTVWRPGDIDFTRAQVIQQRSKLPAEILGSFFAGLEILEATRDGVTIDYLEDQDPVGLSFVINFIETQEEYRDILVEFRPCRAVESIDIYVYRPVTDKDNVEVDQIEFEDLLVPYRARDLQTAERVTQLYWLTPYEVQTKIQDEGWDITEEEMEIISGASTGERYESTIGHSTDSLKRQRDVVTGQVSGGSSSRKRGEPRFDPIIDNKILMLRVYAYDDLDGDGIGEELIYHIPYAISKIVKTQYLEETCPHGRRPFAELHSKPISNRFYSWSLGQILAPINLEVNTIINSTNDAQELINNPFFFYVPSLMTGDPKKYARIEPGTGIAVHDVNAVMFPKFQQEPLANLFVVDSLLLYADRLTVAPQAMGSSQVRNSPRTARGTLALLSEASIQVDNYIMAAQKGGWAELMYQIYALYEAFASDETWKKVTGRDRVRAASSSVRRRLEFQFEGNTVNTNKQVMQSMAQVTYNTLIANPLYAADPKALFALVEYFLRHFNEGGDVEKLKPSLPSMATRQSMSQEKEIELMRQGMPIDVLPFDDDVEHLRILFQFQGSKDFGNWSEHQVALLAAHASGHQRQLFMKQQQNQTPQGGTQANNIPQGISNDLNVLEGGVQ